MKKNHTRLSYIFAAFLIIGSIFVTPYCTSFANGASDPAIAKETKQDAFARDGYTEKTFEENINGEDDHSTFSDEMLKAAINRYKKPQPQNADPWDDPGSDPHKILSGASLPYTSDGKVIALHIDFPQDPEDSPNHAHPEEDNETALENALGFLHDYYQRASYGKLNITGDVYSYSAIKPRGDYDDSSELLSEAMLALDEQVNFKDYDANNDDWIDCILMHIPFNPNDSWGTTWWPSCNVVSWPSDQPTDGVNVGSNIILSRNIAQEDGRTTLVHEIGHAMGFPDYYSYDTQATDSELYPTLTGTLTFDMMDNNTGDHNGFSKWVAGWLTEEDVTYVWANKNGVRAYRGGQEIGTKNEDGSVTLDLSGFDTDEIEETGGIIVVGNDLENGVFSDYYMLQYDTFAGNEKVYYKREPVTPLSSGFRVFRVQAQLQDGQLIHSNTAGKLFDKLIELVDHDYMEGHSRSINPYVTASYEDKDPYGCMYYAGDQLTPATDPSTNFLENINAGFTGIYMDFLESEETYGSVKIWYSEEEKPAEVEFQLELTSGDALPGGYAVSFESNQQLSLANQYGIYGFIDNMGAFAYYIRSMSISDNTLSGKIYCDPDILKKDSSFVVRFVDGTFYTIGGKGSPQIDINIPVSQDLIELTESGYVEGTGVIDTNYGDPGVHKFTPVYQAEDGSYYFYEYSNTYSISEDGSTILHKYSFTEDAPGALQEELIAADTDEYLEVLELNHSLLRGDPTENVSIVPKDAQLGEYPYVYDAVRIDDAYYVLSFREEKGWSPAAPSNEQGDVLYNAPVKNELALSKLDADGSLIKQIAPVGSEIVQDPSSYRVPNVLIQQGPNEKLAVLLFQPAQEFYGGHLINHAATFFFDRELDFEGRLDNYSTGCGTWLDDGRYIAFTQRVMPGSLEELNKGFDRTVLINYDITGVMDPPQEVNYIPESGTDGKEPEWAADTNEGLSFIIHRVPDDGAETSQKHFLGVQVDGISLAEGKDYAVEFKSIQITLLSAYLKTLSVGPHTISVIFDDADAVNIPFVIREGTPPEPAPVPETGDSANYTLWIVLMAGAVAAVIAVVLITRRRKRG